MRPHTAFPRRQKRSCCQIRAALSMLFRHTPDRLPALALLLSTDPTTAAWLPSSHTLKKKFWWENLMWLFFSTVRSSPARSYSNFSKETKTINKTIILKHASAAYHLFRYLLALQNCHHGFWHVRVAQLGKIPIKTRNWNFTEKLLSRIWLGLQLCRNVLPAVLFTDS